MTVEKPPAPPRLTQAEYDAALDALWAQRPQSLAELEDPHVDAPLVPGDVPDGVPLPVFSVTLGAEMVQVNTKTSLVSHQGLDPEVLLACITPALSLACAEDVRKLITAVEEKYLDVLRPLGQEIRRLRALVAASYLGHPDDLVPAIDDLEATATEAEQQAFEEALDGKAAAAAEAFGDELRRRIAAAGLTTPVLPLGLGGEATEDWILAHHHEYAAYYARINAVEAQLRAEQLQAQAAQAGSGMVS